MNTRSERRGTFPAFLKGRRINLRPPLPTDLPALMRWRNDGDIMPFVSFVTPCGEKSEREWLERQNTDKDDITFVIETKAGKPIGTLGLHRIDWVSRTAETGAMIGEAAYRSRGYGTEAKMVILTYIFDTLNLRKICSRVYGFNRRSAAYSQKCGYVIEARQRAHVFRLGKYHDVIHLAVTRKPFLAARAAWEKRHGSLPTFTGA